MLDTDLAAVYGTPTKVLVQSVQRNIERFPGDFAFRLTRQEFTDLRSQSVTSSLERNWGGRRHLPYAFTEQGVAMLSSVLRTPRAIQANIAIMRAFVQMRGLHVSHEDLERKVQSLEKKYDTKFKIVFDAIRELMAPQGEPPPARRAIGFRSPQDTVPASSRASRTRRRPRGVSKIGH